VAVERIDPKNVHPLAWADHVHRYIWAKGFCQGVVLDVGCGVAYGSEVILESGRVATYLGVDVSEEAVRKARSDFGGVFVSIIQASCYGLPVSASSVDTIICFEMLEHLDCPGLAMAEFARVLSPSGIVLGSVPSREQEELVEQIYGRNRWHKERFNKAKLIKLVQSFFPHLQLYGQSLGVVDVIGLLPRSWPNAAVIDVNPGIPGPAPGPILFVAGQRHVDDDGNGPDVVRILPASSVYAPEREVAASEARAQALADQLAAEQAQRQALADQLAAEQAQRRALADQLAAEQAQRQALADQLAAEQAQRRALADQLAAEQAQRQALADQLAAEQAQRQALADQLAAFESELGAIVQAT